MMLESYCQAFHELPFCLMTDFFWWNRLHIRESSFPSSPSYLTHLHLCLLSLTPNGECRSCQNCTYWMCHTSRKEQFSPSSPQHWGFMILLFFIWLNPRGGAVYIQPAHSGAVLSPYRVLSPRSLLPWEDHPDHLLPPRGQECPRSPLRAIWWFRWEAGGGFGAPKGEEGAQHTQFRMEAGCPASSNPDSSQHSSSSFLRKKSQMFRDAGTARARQQLQSGITFLDFCAWHSLLALNWVL